MYEVVIGLVVNLVVMVVVEAMGSEKELGWMGWLECVVDFRRKRYLILKV